MTGARRGGDPAEALLRRTHLRLAAVTMLMVTTLVVAVGVTTILAATALMRQGIDRALDHAIADTHTLHELFEDDGVTRPLGEADTFVQLVTADGQVLGTTMDANLAGLPDLAAIAAASRGDDRRSGTYGATSIRLLTRLVPDVVVEDDDAEVISGGPVYAQAGFNLTLQDRLEGQLLMGIAVVGVLGVVGAFVVTLFVTRRALTPIREAFATERRFVAAASHELQTPTSIIRASAEILQREQLVSAEGALLVSDIIGETDRLGRLVSDLLALATLEAGAVSLRVEEADLDDWFEAITRRARAVTESRGLRFATERTAGSPQATIESDRDRLDQIVLILLDNAIDHSPPDGEVVLGLRVDTVAGAAEAEVRDQGPGIPAEELERIFEPFARGQRRQRAAGGSGLGLAIARELVGRLGAELSVTTVPGSGAAFRLTIPLSRSKRTLASRPDG